MPQGCSRSWVSVTTRYDALVLRSTICARAIAGAASRAAAVVVRKSRRRGNKPSWQQGCAGLARTRPVTILDAAERGDFSDHRLTGELQMSKSILMHENGGPEK